jgi:hypothetical protein
VLTCAHSRPWGRAVVVSRLCAARADKVYEPAWPFPFELQLERGVLQCFAGLDAAFLAAYREPCVVLCDHATLRLGDAVPLLTAWRAAPANAIIFTDPDFDPAEVRR